MKQTRRMAFAPSNGHVVAAGGAAAHVLISRRRRRRWRGTVKGGREGKRRGGEQGEMGEGFVTPHSDILEFNIAASPHQLLQPSVKLKSHGPMVTWSRGHMIWRSHDLEVTWSPHLLQLLLVPQRLRQAPPQLRQLTGPLRHLRLQRRRREREKEVEKPLRTNQRPPRSPK